MACRAFHIISDMLDSALSTRCGWVGVNSTSVCHIFDFMSIVQAMTDDTSTDVHKGTLTTLSKTMDARVSSEVIAPIDQWLAELDVRFALNCNETLLT